MQTTTIIDDYSPEDDGRETLNMLERIDTCARSGYEHEASLYRQVLRGCADGAKPPRDYTPFRQLGPVMWIAFAVLFSFPVGMIVGAGAKPCVCEAGAR